MIICRINVLIIWCINKGEFSAYGFVETYAPTEPNSYLMGLAIKKTDKNIYGITIKEY